ncbi:hypothetical protein EV426DRAFT_41206 [Tirmania nivea]|nr:hypothetical protein EV426DRAFT_41206 [Tirmania nivea]
MLPVCGIYVLLDSGLAFSGTIHVGEHKDVRKEKVTYTRIEAASSYNTSMSSNGSRAAKDRLEQVTAHLQPLETIARSSAGKQLIGKVCIITGCDSALGIGRASAHLFAANGAKAIYICDYADTHLYSHEAELRKLYPGVDVYARKFDAADEEGVRAIVGEAVMRYGHLDVFFANAGVLGAKDMKTKGAKLVGDIEAGEFMETLRVNTLSVFLAVKHASKAMMFPHPDKPALGGSIIATASVAGIRSGAGGSDYSASKSAVINLMQTSAYQLQGTSIRCNALCPGLIETGMTSILYEAARAKGVEQKIGQLNPLKRGGTAGEVARTVLWLAGEGAGYVNAQAVAVDGGLSGSLPVMPGRFY